jgi:hypothetical protein
MPTRTVWFLIFSACGSFQLDRPGGKQPSCQQARDQELGSSGETARTMPAATPVKQLRAAGSRQTDEVFDVGSAGNEGADGCRVCESSPGGQEGNNAHPAHDLEAEAPKTPVRHPIAGEMYRNAKQRSSNRGADGRPHGRARRCMHRSDHACLVARADWLLMRACPSLPGSRDPPRVPGDLPPRLARRPRRVDARQYLLAAAPPLRPRAR